MTPFKSFSFPHFSDKTTYLSQSLFSFETTLRFVENVFGDEGYIHYDWLSFLCIAMPSAPGMKFQEALRFSEQSIRPFPKRQSGLLLQRRSNISCDVSTRQE